MRANTGLQEVICSGFLHTGWGVASPPVPWWEIWLYKRHITTGKPQCPQIPKGLEEIFCHVVKGLVQGALQECWVPPKARGEIKKEGRSTFIVHCIHWLTQTPRGPSVKLNPQALVDTQTSDSGNTRLRSRNPLPLEGLAKFGFLSQYCLERRICHNEHQLLEGGKEVSPNSWATPHPGQQRQSDLHQQEHHWETSAEQENSDHLYLPNHHRYQCLCPRWESKQKRLTWCQCQH